MNSNPILIVQGEKKSNFFEIISLLEKYKYNLSTISKIKYINNEIALIDAYFKKNN